MIKQAHHIGFMDVLLSNVVQVTPEYDVVSTLPVDSFCYHRNLGFYYIAMQLKFYKKMIAQIFQKQFKPYFKRPIRMFINRFI